jgi:hypothetical protein
MTKTPGVWGGAALVARHDAAHVGVVVADDFKDFSQRPRTVFKLYCEPRALLMDPKQSQEDLKDIRFGDDPH